MKLTVSRILHEISLIGLLILSEESFNYWKTFQRRTRMEIPRRPQKVSDIVFYSVGYKT